MPVEIHRPDQRRYVKALIMSPAGHGKTTLLGTAMEDDRTSPMLLMDFEGGWEALAGLDIDVVQIRSWDDYSEVFEALVNEEPWTIPGSRLEEGEFYLSLGIDSISETHIWGLLSRLDEKGPSRNDPDLIEQGDYGVVSTQMRRLLREFRDLPMHVFYTSGVKDDEEKGVGKIKVPSLAGQASSEVVHLVGVCAYLAKGEDEEGEEIRVLFFDQKGYRTKVRTPWKKDPPEPIDNPTMTSLLDALEVGPPPKPSSKAKPKQKAGKK